jgi:thiamine biosynthesis protein ThiC
LTQRAQEKGCQVMVEGPGHVPYELKVQAMCRTIRSRRIWNCSGRFVTMPRFMCLAPW